jgi:hypothetical protein
MPAFATGEVVTVSGASIGLTAATYVHAISAFIEVQAQPIRWRADGTAPTSTVGFKAIDGTDEEYLVMSGICASCTAAAHTIDMDGSVDTTTGTPAAQQRSLVAFTLELAAAGSPSVPIRRLLMGVGQ